MLFVITNALYNYNKTVKKNHRNGDTIQFCINISRIKNKHQLQIIPSNIMYDTTYNIFKENAMSFLQHYTKFSGRLRSSYSVLSNLRGTVNFL